MRVVKFASATAKTVLELTLNRIKQYLVENLIDSISGDFRPPIIVSHHPPGYFLFDPGVTKVEFTSLPKSERQRTGVLMQRMSMTHRSLQILLVPSLAQGFKLLRSPALTNHHVLRQSEPSHLAFLRKGLSGHFPEIVVQLLPTQVAQLLETPFAFLATWRNRDPLQLLGQLDYDPFFWLLDSKTAPAHLQVGVKFPLVDPARPLIFETSITVGKAYLLLGEDLEGDDQGVPRTGKLSIVALNKLRLFISTTTTEQEIGLTLGKIEVENEGNLKMCEIKAATPEQASLSYIYKRRRRASLHISHQLYLASVKICEPVHHSDVLLEFLDHLAKLNIPTRQRLYPAMLSSEPKIGAEIHLHCTLEALEVQLSDRHQPGLVLIHANNLELQWTVSPTNRISVKGRIADATLQYNGLTVTQPEIMVRSFPEFEKVRFLFILLFALWFHG